MFIPFLAVSTYHSVSSCLLRADCLERNLCLLTSRHPFSLKNIYIQLAPKRVEPHWPLHDLLQALSSMMALSLPGAFDRALPCIIVSVA